LLNDENEAQVEAFLARYPMFKQLAIGAPLPDSLYAPALRLSPRAHGTDGFFAAILVRDP
jgi:16S rRNA (cytosine967-C5)-methyltransferase